MPLAVSKIVSEKLERRQYKNAYKIFKGALFYGAVLGVLFGLFAFLGADWLSVYKSQPVPSCTLQKVLASYCILECRGFSRNDMIQQQYQILSRLSCNAVVNNFAAYKLHFWFTVYQCKISKYVSKSAGPAYIDMLSGTLVL